MFEDALGSGVGRPDPVGTDRYKNKDVIDGRYVVLRRLGFGGMGTVLEVGDPIEKRRRALKYCNGSGDDRIRFKREVRIMRTVNHPNVVPVLAANLEHDPPYFVMPLATSCLSNEILKLKANEAEAIAAFKEVCLGIQALHAAGIVHRDLKPHNILRFGPSLVAVSDLGLAKLEDRDTTVLTQTRAVIGTVDYLAPEQFEPGGSRESDARTDIFQLGLVLYHLITGRSPRGIDPSLLPSGLGFIVQKATKPLPSSRFQSVGQLLDSLSYYETSKREKDSEEEYENLVQEAEGLLAEGQIRSDNLRRLLGMIANIDPSDHRRNMADFDRIPTEILRSIAQDFTAELLPGLMLYREAIRDKVSGRAFAYADTVAARMSELFIFSKSPEVQTVALQILLIAADSLNRFNAMGIFARLLCSVKDIGVALPVADMIREEAEHYRIVGRSIAVESLHPAISAAHIEVMKPRPRNDEEDSLEIGEIPF